MNYKFGRLPRTYRSDIPHYSSFAMGTTLEPPPASVDWTTGVNPDWHTMLNDQLGDYTCAAAFHAMQLWSVHGRAIELTEPDAKVQQMYTEFCGYDPAAKAPDGTNPTDQGGVEQDVLARWFSEGVPIAEGAGWPFDATRLCRSRSAQSRRR
jgi:hypothetical protein